MISRPHPSLTPGRLKISFTVKRNLEATPTVMVTGGVAPWRVSTKAATVLDLLRHQATVGGLESVVRVLRDFAPSIKPTELRAALDALDQRSTAQRLGFLLDRLDHPALAKVTSAWLGASTHRMPQRLELGTAAPRDLDTDDRWRVAFDPVRVNLALELQ
jgi:predicted transcriptional regulator of viral defense system